MALKYAYDRRLETADTACSVFWVHADNEMTFARDYKTIAEELGVADSLEGTELLKAVREAIQCEPRWLLVLDSADDLSIFGITPTHQDTLCDQLGDITGTPTNLCDYVPSGGSGTVLWTSRDEHIVGTLVGPRQGISVQEMSPDEAMDLLRNSRDKDISTNEVDVAKKLLRELQWLPLAISQAGAYMGRTLTPISEYLSMLSGGKERRRVLMRTEFDRYRRDVPNSVLETWSISIERIRQEDEMAYRILHTIAYINNQDIPFELIMAVGLFGHDEQGQESWEDKQRVVDAVTRLKEFSFLRLRRGEGDVQSYEVHKLVQDATQYGLSIKSSEDETHFAIAALRIVAKLFPDPTGTETWAECEKYVAHALRVGDWAEICEEEVEEVLHLLLKVSSYLDDRGRWREQELVARRGWELGEQTQGGNDKSTIRFMHSLALAYMGQCRHEEAEELGTRTLEKMQQVYGETHIFTIHATSNLALSYSSQGRHDIAESDQIKALELLRQHHRDNQSTIIHAMANLATTYRRQKRYDEAKELQTQALESARGHHGETHCDTMSTMGGLATIYSVQGQYDEAEPIEVKVLERLRQVLGDNHPRTLVAMYNLAITLRKGWLQWIYSRSAGILWMCSRSAGIQKLIGVYPGQSFWERHLYYFFTDTDWNTSPRNLDAEQLMDECVQLRRSVLGPDHIDTRHSVEVHQRWFRRAYPGYLVTHFCFSLICGVFTFCVFRFLVAFYLSFCWCVDHLLDSRDSQRCSFLTRSWYHSRLVFFSFDFFSTFCVVRWQDLLWATIICVYSSVIYTVFL